MFLAFLSLAVLGVVLLLTVIALYSRKDLLRFSSGEESSHRQTETARYRSRLSGGDHVRQSEKPAANDRVGEPVQTPSKSADSVKEKSSDQSPGFTFDRDGEERYIPVLERKEPIPGVRDSERLHFMATGVLYSMEAEKLPEKIKEKELTTEIEGTLALTSGHVVVYNDGDSKRFTLGSIEKHHFDDSFLIMKRKNVKYKKDVIKITKNPVEFTYILQTLL
jgi:hypothetical protein